MSVISSLRQAWSRKRLISLIYVIQLALALTIGLQVYQVFEGAIGHSLALEGLKSGYAHTVINDLLNIHGPSLAPLLGQVRWMILLYMIISVFLGAGIWYKICHADANFWMGASRHFFSFLLVGFVFALLFLVLSAIMWGPYFTHIEHWMEYWSSEEWILWLAIIIAIFWFLIAALLFVCSCFAKKSIILKERSAVKSLGYGLSKGSKKYIRLLPGLFLFAVFITLLYCIAAYINELTMASSALGILLAFLLQQVVVWLKIWLRIGAYEYVKDAH